MPDITHREVFTLGARALLDGREVEVGKRRPRLLEVGVSEELDVHQVLLLSVLQQDLLLSKAKVEDARQDRKHHNDAVLNHDGGCTHSVFLLRLLLSSNGNV